MAEFNNQLVDSLFKVLKERNISVPEFADLVNIPKDRIYKWRQKGTRPKSQDERVIGEWLFGKKMDNVPHGTPQAGGLPSLEQADNSTLLRILDNLSAAHREISESNNKLADNEKMILMRMPTAGSHSDSPSNEYATLQGVRGLLIEFYADVKKTTLQEAESVLGKKVVDAKKRVAKKDILSDGGK